MIFYIKKPRYVLIVVLYLFLFVLSLLYIFCPVNLYPDRKKQICVVLICFRIYYAWAEVGIEIHVYVFLIKVLETVEEVLYVECNLKVPAFLIYWYVFLKISYFGILCIYHYVVLCYSKLYKIVV